MFTIESDKIPKTIPEVQRTIQIPISFRRCKLGEILISDGKVCKKCSPGTYVLDFNQTNCKNCPENALCYGGSKLAPLHGYWRADHLSDIFY